MNLLSSAMAMLLLNANVPFSRERGQTPYDRPTPARFSRKKFGYARGIVNVGNNRRAAAMHHRGLRDEHGAYTLVGRDPIDGSGRKWLAGISAQRGY